MNIFDAINRKKDELKKDYERGLEYAKDAETLAKFVAEILPDVSNEYSFWVTFGDINITLPRIASEISRYEKLFKDFAESHDDVFFTSDDTSADDGIYQIRLVHKAKGLYQYSSCYVSIRFSPNEEGSTCVLTQIGKRKVEREIPVYEVTCPEGAGQL